MMMLNNPSMMHQPIILLKSGTEASSGPQLILSNIRACQSIVDAVKTTLGPMGQDKLIQASNGKTHITNDGATIMDLLNVVHPAAKILVDISESQDAEIGDGTTSVVILAGELLQQARHFIEDGVHPKLIIAGYRLGLELALARVREIGIDLTKEYGAESAINDVIRKCAETSLNSKLLASHKEFFGKLVYDAVTRLGIEGGSESSKIARGTSSVFNKSLIGIKKIPGGSATESACVDGVAFPKCFSYAGFEKAPKTIENPKILLLNMELELKAEKENAEIRVDTADDYQKMIDAEWKLLVDRLDTMVEAGANVVLSRLAIGDIATQYFADRGVFCAGRVEEGDLRRMSLATGGRVLMTVSDLLAKKDSAANAADGAAATPASISPLGTCGLFEERPIGRERYNFFSKCPLAGSSTILLRGGAKQFIDEAERSLNDAIMTCCRALQTRQVVGGGGAVEMEVMTSVCEAAKQIEGKQQLILEAFGKSFEIIPRTLSSNSGKDANEVVNELRKAHYTGQLWMGVNCFGETPIIDTVKTFVWEPMSIKLNSFAAATEAACAILSVDEMIKNPKSNPEPNGPKAPAPMGRGGPQRR